jgi:hypothetical protein
MLTFPPLAAYLRLFRIPIVPLIRPICTLALSRVQRDVAAGTPDAHQAVALGSPRRFQPFLGFHLDLASEHPRRACAALPHPTAVRDIDAVTFGNRQKRLPDEAANCPPDFTNSTLYVGAALSFGAAAPTVNRSCRICSATTPIEVRISFTVSIDRKSVV